MHEITALELSLISLVVGLLGAGGGIWVGGRGKVRSSECEIRHFGLDQRLSGMASDISEVKDDIKTILRRSSHA